MDSQYDATEYQTRVGWGHGCVDDVVRFAIAGDQRRCFTRVFTERRITRESRRIT